LTGALTERLEKFIVADDVQLVDIAALYGMLTVQGPRAEAIVRRAPMLKDPVVEHFHFTKMSDAALGELYLVNQPRLGTAGFDLFAPVTAMPALAEELISAARSAGGGAAGWQAFETARIESGIPRFGVDMDETNFPQECGIEERAVSYTKGCYIGQEVLNRIHTMGHVNRALRGLHLHSEGTVVPSKGDKIFKQGKEVGHITSAVCSPKLHSVIALGYVRKEADHPDAEVLVRSKAGEIGAKIVPMPFQTDSESRL
jgi:folate-binding protein YgfZ